MNAAIGLIQDRSQVHLDETTDNKLSPEEQMKLSYFSAANVLLYR
jgi:hypothetical protein